MNYVVIRDHHEVAETPLESLKSNRVLSAKSQVVDLKFLGGLKKMNHKQEGNRERISKCAANNRKQGNYEVLNLKAQ